jgi:hypothetical protein
MPKQPINYENTIIYKLVCKDLNVKDLYVGHTTNFIKRKCCHRESCSNPESNAYNFRVYDFIRKNGDWNNWDMIEVEKYPCKDKKEATARERYWYEELKGTLNSNVPTRTMREYREEKKEKISQNKKEWYEKNKEKYQNDEKYVEKRREWVNKSYRNTIDKIKKRVSERVNCECCGKELRRDSLWKHRKSCPSRPQTK